ncbi:MAG TPA: AMP-binding protein [Caulobacteraceae bacterium]
MTPSGRRPVLWRSEVQDVEWPPIAAGYAAVLGALFSQINETQWMEGDEIELMQRRQLQVLATHCAKYSPYFLRTLHGAGLTPVDLAAPGGLQRLPRLSRRALQGTKDIFCSMAPNSHMPIVESTSSGSTGTPVVVRTTSVGGLTQMACILRGYFWHGRNLADPVCAIRGQSDELERRDDWGPPASVLFRTGPALHIPRVIDIATRIDMIEEFAPKVLTVTPSNLLAIVRRCAETGRRLPSLELICSIAEPVHDETRDEVRAAFGIEIVDTYSTQELGCIAIQCPVSGLHHVMAERMVVEVLDDEGEPCAEGQAGRLVITDMHNFATPLFRYEVGDWAEPGPPCPCGRGLPTIRRILGRERNLIVLPDGRRYWPRFGYARLVVIAPIIQFQFVQEARERIEMRLVMARPLTEAEAKNLTAYIQSRFDWPFEVRFTYFENEIPTGPGGKFEDFMCLVD